MKEGDDDRVDIIISTMDGLIDSVEIPEHLDNVVVVFRDYNVESFVEGTEVFEDESGRYTVKEYRANA